MDKAVGLKAWISVSHPRYRLLLGQLLGLGLLLAALAYAENSLLQGFVRSLASDLAPDEGGLARMLGRLAGSLGLPLAFLAGIFAVGLLRAWMSARSGYLGNELSMRSRDDLEGQVLFHLLHRDDSFYSRHSPGEILNRLEVDIYRIIQRRETLVDVVSSALLVASNLIFFGLSDWRLAAAVVVICVVGTLVTQRASRPVQAADNRFWNQHDRVKTSFEDYLRGFVEIQVRTLFRPILARLRGPQADRLSAFRTWARADERVALSRGGWPVLAFLFSVLIVLYFYRGDSGGAAGAQAAERLSLIPVLVFALPGVFGHVTYLASLGLSFGLAQNSIDRILEYESEKAIARQAHDDEQAAVGAAAEASSPREPGPARPIRVEGLTYRYPASDGSRQGGIEDVSTAFQPGTWASIVGGAGSGKSTLVNLILGRTKPQAGRVLLGETDLAAAPPDLLATEATYMPQKVILLDASIRANLYLGWSGAGDLAVSTADLDLFERLGLGPICRLKALDLRPSAGGALDAAGLAGLRAAAREAVSALGHALLPFEDGHVDPGKPFFEALIAGRADDDVALDRLTGTAAQPFLKELARSGLGDELIVRGRVVLEQSRNLLELEDYQDFVQLSPENLARAEWELRRAGLQVVAKAAPSLRDRMALAAVGLTSRPAEWGASHADARTLAESSRERFPHPVSELRARLQGAWAPFEGHAVHPFLSWRDNLLFATTALTNQRQRRRLDDALLDVMGRAAWSPFFVAEGLHFEVGRNGSRLSGGQGQLIALARALLPRTPFVVLDEPTSALDPASRDRVADFLLGWREGRVVLTISHDPHFVRRCDEVHVMQGGRLVDRGPFDTLAAGSEAFRSVFRLGEG